MINLDGLKLKVQEDVRLRKREQRGIVLSSSKAGKRLFDVKETREKFSMTITESKRNFDNDGNVHYQKHSFSYIEDFEKFEDGFIDATDKIKELMATGNYRDPIAERASEEEILQIAILTTEGNQHQKQLLRRLQRTKLNSTTSRLYSQVPNL